MPPFKQVLKPANKKMAKLRKKAMEETRMVTQFIKNRNACAHISRKKAAEEEELHRRLQRPNIYKSKGCSSSTKMSKVSSSVIMKSQEITRKPMDTDELERRLSLVSIVRKGLLELREKYFAVQGQKEMSKNSCALLTSKNMKKVTYKIKSGAEMLITFTTLRRCSKPMKEQPTSVTTTPAAVQPLSSVMKEFRSPPPSKPPVGPWTVNRRPPLLKPDGKPRRQVIFLT